MGISDYLDNLLSEGKRLGYFEVMPIGRITKSCCLDAKTEVIDFDKVKERLVKEKGLQSLKSCDGLKILPHLARIDFIEMKGIKHLVHYSKNKSHPERLDEELRKKIQDDFDFFRKLDDSYTLLIFLAKLKEFPFDKNSSSLLAGAQKGFIILTDIDPWENAIELIALNLQYLASFSTTIEAQAVNYFSEAIEQIPNQHFANFQKPMLKFCSEIDAFYPAG